MDSTSSYVCVDGEVGTILKVYREVSVTRSNKVDIKYNEYENSVRSKKKILKCNYRFSILSTDFSTNCA